MLIFFGITISLLLLFTILFKRNYSSILNGLIFNFLIISIIALYSALVLPLNNFILNISVFVLAIPFIIMILFGGFILIILFLLSGRKLRKNESRSFSNSLSLISGILLIFYFILKIFIPNANIPVALDFILSAISIIVLVYFFHVTSFISSAVISYCVRPKKNKDFIIVLGSGLIDGEVPPLLANRINKAIQFYKQQEKYTSPPTILFSGGQGNDEPRPESIAMQEYALNKGIPIENTMVETESRNTEENFKYSKLIIDNTKEKSEIVFSTSDYHVFRSAILAKRAGLQIYGLGAKTIWYYFLNALIREYIAVLWMHKKKHLIITLFTLSIYILFYILNYFLIKT